MIDATRRAGLARFLNHSCAPNCRVERWTSAGDSVMAVVANQKIDAGDLV